MQKKGLLILLIISGIILACYPANKGKVNWLTLSEAESLYAKEPRPILVDVYTGWCSWCKVMDKKTYANEQVSAYINSNFYPVKLNAESKTDFIFNKKEYRYDPSSGNNRLAVYLLGGLMEFPSTIFLRTPGANPVVVSGYMKPAEFESYLRYYGEKQQSSLTLNEFLKTFKGSW